MTKIVYFYLLVSDQKSDQKKVERLKVEVRTSRREIDKRVNTQKEEEVETGQGSELLFGLRKW